nr:hypothetical protein [Tanacetum cinerariifolium]
MPTKIELTLEQSQQGVSNDVLKRGAEWWWFRLAAGDDNEEGGRLWLTAKVVEVRWGDGEGADAGKMMKRIGGWWCWRWGERGNGDWCDDFRAEMKRRGGVEWYGGSNRSEDGERFWVRQKRSPEKFFGGGGGGR